MRPIKERIMPKIIDMIGQKYDRLTVLSKINTNHNGHIYECLCDCGNIKSIEGKSIRSGLTKSCGCIRSQYTSNKNKTHDKTKTGAYKSWKAMKTRCTNSNTPYYKNYGERGISIYERWLNFENFYEDMGDRPEGKTLERIDNSKGYCKENCKWATIKEQNRNTRQVKLLTYQGETLCMREWAEKLSIPYPTLQDRIRRGWDIERALTL